MCLKYNRMEQRLHTANQPKKSDLRSTAGRLRGFESHRSSEHHYLDYLENRNLQKKMEKLL